MANGNARATVARALLGAEDATCGGGKRSCGVAGKAIEGDCLAAHLRRRWT